MLYIFHFCLERVDGVKEEAAHISVFLGHSADNCHQSFSNVTVLCLEMLIGLWDLRGSNDEFVR